ncbi:E3 Ubiquitin ligase family protein [Rhynchospora pubera]|uniref:RING-type E3 ubiquitin transferase n=1 Tax=Rhynchospora pubera TaxID=906938 RepID=A0AAV8CLF9_9POAL|nr:E3 Ubiquitin ligase family protein [Rhynchospora pubera]
MIPWGGIGCCLSAAALYVLGRSSGRDADVLKSITKVGQIKDLAFILDTASKVLPLIVTISGRVGSESPMICEQSGLRGVIVEEIHEQHFLKHNDAGSWIQDSAVMVNKCKDVPWYLDDGTGRVFIVGARTAAGLVLTIASETFEESGRSLVRGTLDYLQGLKMLGVKKTERVLATGTALTVVGEAVKDDIGTVRIQKPHKGPFYVSPNGIDQLIENLGRWARCYKFASGGLAVAGIFLLARHAFYYFLERKRRHELQKRVQAAAAQRQSREAEAQNGSSEELEDSRKKDRLSLDICVICLEQEYNTVFVPCGHMCCCIACSSQLSSCPLCRRRIDQVVKTFRH